VRSFRTYAGKRHTECKHCPVANSLTPYNQDGNKNDLPVPEVVDPRIADVEAVARWFDYAFVLPGGFRFGLAGIIGLIPGIGDIIDGLVSLYIVYRAIQLGVPRVTIARMMINVGIEGVAGSLPFIGDLFDVVFKANLRNLQILNRHLTQPRQQSMLDWLFFIGTVLLVAAAVALPVIVLAALIRRFA
jgi:hypothetical protein